MSKPVTALDVFHALSTGIAQHKGVARVVKTQLSDLELLRDCLSAEIDENKSLQEQLKKEREAHKKEKDLAAANFNVLRQERDALVKLLQGLNNRTQQEVPHPFDTHTYPPMAGRGKPHTQELCHVAPFDPQYELMFAEADDGTIGQKFDSGKLRHSLLPSGVITEVLKVLEFGARKYKENNWQHVTNGRDRYYDAALRHITAWREGELEDSETGVNHLAHAICCLMFLLWFDLR